MVKDAPVRVDIDRSSTRERILREASMLFASKGYGGASTRGIAAAVGIRQPSLFHHFDSKQAIMEALLEADLTEATAVAEQQAAAYGSPALRLLRYLLWDITTTCNSPYNLAGVSNEHVVTAPEFAAWRKLLERLRAARRKMIQDGVASGEFVDVDPEMAERALTWMILGNIANVAGRGVPNADQIARQLASFALRALLRDRDQLPGLMDAAVGTTHD